MNKPKPSYLSNVSEIYHDLQEVFSKDQALSLVTPMTVPLISCQGATFSTNLLYNLSDPEHEDSYTGDSLAAGMI